MSKLKSRVKNIFMLTFVFVLALVFMTSSAIANPGEKLKTEQILEKHLESIGTKEARGSIVSIMASGTAKAVARGRTAGETAGLVVIASEGKKNLIGMRFPNNDYPYEKMGYDGKEFTVGFLRPGIRSDLGIFLRENEDTFKVGVFGGVLSTSWELLNYNKKVGKLKCKGTAKIDKVKHYKCNYDPKKSDLKIKVYFHPETFRHVRTEYTRVISGGQGIGINNSARQIETRFKLIEDFSDFKKVNDLTLPHSYKISYTKQGRDARSGRENSVNIEWMMNLTNFTFNEKIDSKQFKVDTF